MAGACINGLRAGAVPLNAGARRRAPAACTYCNPAVTHFHRTRCHLCHVLEPAVSHGWALSGCGFPPPNLTVPPQPRIRCAAQMQAEFASSLGDDEEGLLSCIERFITKQVRCASLGER